MAYCSRIQVINPWNMNLEHDDPKAQHIVCFYCIFKPSQPCWTTWCWRISMRNALKARPLQRWTQWWQCTMIHIPTCLGIWLRRGGVDPRGSKCTFPTTWCQDVDLPPRSVCGAQARPWASCRRIPRGSLTMARRQSPDTGSGRGIRHPRACDAPFGIHNAQMQGQPGTRMEAASKAAAWWNDELVKSQMPRACPKK